MASVGRGKKIENIIRLSPPKTIHRLYPDSGASDWIGIKKGDPSPIVYFSGTASSKEWDEDLFSKKTGARFRCLSYAYAGPNSPMFMRRYLDSIETFRKNKVRVMLDSGAHSFHKMMMFGSNLSEDFSKEQREAEVTKTVDYFIGAYVDYVKVCYQDNILFDWYVTLDYRKHCPTIYKVTQQLMKRGIWPVPAYHGDQDILWLKRYISDGHKLVGIGMEHLGKRTPDAKRRYYDQVFNLCVAKGVSCHGFALTGDLMFQYPWYSCDSTTYLKAAAYGKILDIIPEKQRVALIHITPNFCKALSFDNLCKSVRKQIRNSVEAKGYDFDKLRESLFYRAMYNAEITLAAVRKHMERK